MAMRISPKIFNGTEGCISSGGNPCLAESALKTCLSFTGVRVYIGIVGENLSNAGDLLIKSYYAVWLPSAMRIRIKLAYVFNSHVSLTLLIILSCINARPLKQLNF